MSIVDALAELFTNVIERTMDMARNKGPQTETAYNYIKDKILAFEYVPGTELNVQNLEQTLGMSRSPLYEAVLRLMADGLMEKSGGKTIVSPISKQDIIEICQVRQAIEIAALEILFDNGGPSAELLNSLTELIEQMKQEKNNLMNKYKYDDRFHTLLLYAANNSRMASIAERMRLQIFRARWLNVITPARLSEANDEHEALYLALKEKDREKSIAAMHRHLNNSRNNFEIVLDMLSFNPQLLRGIATFVDEKIEAI